MTRVRPFPSSQLELDDEHSAAYWKGQELELSRESYLVLSAIAREPGKVHSVNDLLELTKIQICGPDSYTDLVAHFQRIQFAFAKPSYSSATRGPIKVIIRQGYKWNEQTDLPPNLFARLFKVARAKFG